jgi:hypothetical protein
MKLIRLTVQTAKKRPVIIVLPAILVLLFIVVNSYNPVLPILMGLSNITGSSVFDGIVSALQLVLEPNILPLAILTIAAIVLLGSILAGILLSGYLNILNNSLEGTAKANGDFNEGIRKYFKKIFLITLRVLLFFAFFICFILVACIPAIIITRAAATTRPEMLLASIAVDILTVGVLFFSLMFTRSYLFYWYPAALKVNKNSFREAKRFVDKQFWQIVIRFILFDIVFIAFQYIIFIIGPIGLKLLLNWVFCTVFFTVLTVFIVSSYKEYSHS